MVRKEMIHYKRASVVMWFSSRRFYSWLRLQPELNRPGPGALDAGMQCSCSFMVRLAK